MRVGVGYWLLSVLVAFIVWANFFTLDQSIRAQGQVIPQERTQIIQVADGGVLERLNVVEGQRVAAGEVLASLEKDRAVAGVDEIKAQLANLQIAGIRARAEAESIQPDFGGYRQTHRGVVLAQQALFDQNRQELEDEVASLKRSLELAESELSIFRKLFKTGDVAELEVVRIEREVVDLKSRISASNNKHISEARSEIAGIEEDIALHNHRLSEQESILDHTDIIAPLDGVVKYLRINTLGGVLRSGDELMHISPTEGGYIIEAKISPADIGSLDLGLPVTVRLEAFDFSVYGSLQGELTYISSDTLSEQQQDTTQTFYRAHVKVPFEQDNAKLSADVLVPGMTATLDIKTGERTVLEFIAKPILRAFSGALTQR